MGTVNDVYNWSSVKALYATVSSMNLAGLIAVVLAVVWAARFQRGFGDYLNLVAPGDGSAWTTVIISAAVLCSPAYILGLKSCFHLRTESSEADPEEEEQTVDDLQKVANRLLFFHVIACLLSGFLVAALNATYLALLSGFQQKSRDGLMQAIQRYGSDATAKERVDAVQTEFECCGDSGYEDWFRVPWLEPANGPEHPEHSEHPENGPRLEEQSAPDEREEESTRTADVPFSCCSNDVPKPCVHHDVLNPGAAYDYNPKHPTIATLGCRTKIMDRAVTVRLYLSGYLAVVTVYQVTLSFLSRLLQTAHSNDLYIGFRKHRYRAWILFGPEGTSSDAASTKRSSRASLLGKRSGRKPPRSLTTTASSSCSSSSSLEEEEVAPKAARKAKSSGVKMLDEIRSRISSAKSKSLPLLVESKTSIADKLRVPERDVRSSKDGVSRVVGEGAGRGRGESKRNGGGKRLSRRATRSEVVARRNYDSSELSASSRSINEDLPPPPPPPPFAARLETELVDDAVVGTRFREQRSFGQNSGRRIKVLERFGNIERRIDGRKTEGRCDRVARRRESGGADFVRVDGDSPAGSDRSGRMKSSPGDVYDRFRGSLQHTLARREAARSRRGSRGRARAGRAAASLEARRSSLLARLGCKNVPPSYRLLANLEDKKRPTAQTYPAPAPTAPPFLQNPWSANCGRVQRRCSVCRRPVRLSPTSSRGSFVQRNDVAPPVNDFLENRLRLEEIRVPWNRAPSISRSGPRR
ncbi:uncharacterized protein LOC143261129 [Megalopta genalis]|uniref:uncharacterized protein LOC143261129 n=1 Tax=Megalopta genalis TaxID=115081 RepID=UPI003FD373B9